MIAYRHPILEQYRAADDSCIVSDDYLKGLEVKFGEATQLAKEAGFDAVDIKSCHGYLLAELASAYNRPGAYGGSFENRFRLLKNGIRAAKVYEDDHFMVTARLGIYDGYATRGASASARKRHHPRSDRAEASGARAARRAGRGYGRLDHGQPLRHHPCDPPVRLWQV